MDPNVPSTPAAPVDEVDVDIEFQVRSGGLDRICPG